MQIFTRLGEMRTVTIPSVEAEARHVNRGSNHSPTAICGSCRGSKST
jgi:hypothetical protein